MIDVKKILVPVDFSENSKAAITYGCEVARQFNAEIHLVNVVDSSGAYAVEMEMIGASTFAYDIVEAEKHAVELLAELPGEVGKDVKVVRATEVGPPVPGIRRYAKEHDIDLIVISTHGYTGLSHLLMGSVAENVVRKAPCPVLTVRPSGHQFLLSDEQQQASKA